MLESIALHEPLEDKNQFFTWLVAELFLNTNGHYMQYEPEDRRPASRLGHELTPSPSGSARTAKAC